MHPVGSVLRPRAGKYLRRNSEEAGKSSTLDVVIAETKAQDVLSNHLAAVILDLVIALRRRLRSQQVRPHRKRSDVDRYRIVRERQSASAHRIQNPVLKLQVREADGVGDAAGVEVNASHVISRVVQVVVNLEAGRKERGVHRILEVVESSKQTRRLARL